MSPGASNFDRLLRHLHRRASFWRVTESTGAGIAIGAGLAGVVALVAMVMNARVDAYAIGICMIALGALMGFVRGVSTRLTPQRVAMEADRQLKLSDLLATALAYRESNEPWKRLVVAQAEREARGIGAGDIILRRLGARAWGGIGVTTAIAVVLVVMAAEPLRVTAGRPSATDSVNIATRTGSTELQAAGASASPVKQTVRPGASRDASQWPSVVDPSENASTGSRVQGATASDGTGGGLAAQKPGETVEQSSTISNVSRDPQTPLTDRGAKVQAGDGRAAAGALGGNDEAVGGSVQGQGRSMHGSDVQMNGPSHGTFGTESRVNVQAVPDAYRDVVRAYFDRQQ